MMMKIKNEPDPLDRLFVSGDEVNRELLARILQPYLRLDGHGGVYPPSPFSRDELTNRQQVVLLLLARKAFALKHHQEDWTPPTELSKLWSIPGGSLRPVLRLLVDERIAEEEQGRYRVNPDAMLKCADLLKQKMESAVEANEPRGQGNTYNKITMRQALEDLMRQGGLDEPKRVSEIIRLVQKRRPGTSFAPFYGVVISFVKNGLIERERKEDTWLYKRKS